MVVQPSISFSDFLAQADTGDVVLWGGSSVNSTGIEFLSNSVYSHSSMVITDPSTNEKCLLQAVPEVFENDPLKGGAKHTGVQAGALSKTMVDLAAYGDSPTWIPYSSSTKGTAAFVQTMWNQAIALDGTPFPSVPLGMAKLLFEGRFEGVERTDKLFCSGLLGLMFKRLGVIDQSVPCNAYFPKDFSSLYPGYLNVLVGSFGEDTTIEMP